MHDYTVSLGMPETYEEITVYLYYDHDEMMAACARAVQGWTVEDCTTRWGGLGLAGDGWFLVDLGHPMIQIEIESQLGKFRESPWVKQGNFTEVNF